MAMDQSRIESGTPADGSAPNAAEEPQRRDRQRSGILGEPAGVPPGDEVSSDGSERDDPVHEQVPNDGQDHWRR
jgi:hypothetical protein